MYKLENVLAGKKWENASSNRNVLLLCMSILFEVVLLLFFEECNQMIEKAFNKL